MFRFPRRAAFLASAAVVASGCLVEIEDLRRAQPAVSPSVSTDASVQMPRVPEPINSDDAGTPAPGTDPSVLFGQPTNLAIAQSYPFEIALDDRYVYWTCSKGVFRARREPDKNEPWFYPVYETTAPSFVAVDANYVYVADTAQGQVMRVNKDGSKAIRLATSTRPFGLMLDGTQVVFTDSADGTVNTVPKAGGVARELARSAATNSGSLWGLAADTDAIYWTNNRNKTVNRIGKRPEISTGILATRTTFEIMGIAVDAKTIYWREGDNSRGALMALPKSGNMPVVVHDKSSAFPRGIAADATGVYFTGGSPQNSMIHRINGNGTGYRTLAAGLANAHSVAIDAGFVYWTNWGGGTIMRIAK